MNKYEEAQLALIENVISKIQEFVNKNITDDNAMTAAVIAEKFLKANPQKISIDDFVKSFRLAVREGKITGIEGAKRAGYRRSGITRTNSADAILNAFLPYADQVQSFIDKHIRGRNKMTCQAIYQQFLKESDGNCKLNEEDFIKGFRSALSKGNLKGIAGAGPYGYKHVDESQESEEDEDASDDVESVTQEYDASGCEIPIDSTHRIIGLDNKNWGYQIKHGNTWVNTAYFRDSHGMIQSIAKRLIDDHLKTLNGFDFKQLENKIVEVENNITQLLKNVMNSLVASKQSDDSAD